VNEPSNRAPRKAPWASSIVSVAAAVVAACSAPAPVSGPLSDVVIDVPAGTCVGPSPDGAVAPSDPSLAWALEDFQPRSCGFGQTYGLEAFRGKPIIVALLAAW